MTAMEWITEVRALDHEMLDKLGVKVGPNRTGEEVVALPYRRNGEVQAHKVRRVGDKDAIKADGGKPPFYWAPAGSAHGLFNADVLADHTLAEAPVIVTEGEFDALSVIQSGFPRCVSIPDGWTDAQSDTKGKPLLDERDRLKRSPCVIVAGDNDKVGRLFVRAVWNILDGHPVRYVEWPEGCKDANETLQKHGEGEVARCINAARLMDPPGGLITGFADAPPAPSGDVITIGDDMADRVMCFHTGFPTIVTGIPSSGKSTFLTWALHRAIVKNNVRVGVSLLETPWPILRDHLSRMTMGRPWVQLAGPEKDALVQKLDGYWRLLHREESEDVSHGMGWVRDMLWAAAVRDGCKIIAFDPWNEIEHRVAQGESVTDYTNAALAKARQWSERFGCALVIVAHPTKTNAEAGAKPRPPQGYDIAGSSAWFNKAAVGVTVHRDEDDSGEHTVIYNWKTKFEQIYPCRRGKVRMDFDPDMMTFRRRA